MEAFKKFGVFAIIFTVFAISAAFASATEVPVVLEKLVFDGEEIEVYETCRIENATTNDTICDQVNSISLLDVEKGDNVEIKLLLNAEADAENVQVEAAIRGYEYGDVEDTSDITHVFDVEENTTYKKFLSIEVPDKMDNGVWTLRVTITDRDSESKAYMFTFMISPERHLLQIKDIFFYPESDAEAGKSVLAKLRIKNIGAKDEESVKVRVSIPDLGIAGSEYIDMIESDETESSEEIWLRIPKCAEPGPYQAVVEITYDEGYEKIFAVKRIDVTKGEKCAPATEPAESNKDDSGFVLPEFPDEPEFDDESGDRENLLRTALEAGLAVLIVILVIAGIIAGIMSISKSN